MLAARARGELPEAEPLVRPAAAIAHPSPNASATTEAAVEQPETVQSLAPPAAAVPLRRSAPQSRVDVLARSVQVRPETVSRPVPLVPPPVRAAGAAPVAPERYGRDVEPRASDSITRPGVETPRSQAAPPTERPAVVVRVERPPPLRPQAGPGLAAGPGPKDNAPTAPTPAAPATRPRAKGPVAEAQPAGRQQRRRPPLATIVPSARRRPPAPPVPVAPPARGPAAPEPKGPAPVHINIGRIVVRAEAPVPAQRPAASASRTPRTVDLADYLNHRDRGRR